MCDGAFKSRGCPLFPMLSLVPGLSPGAVPCPQGCVRLGCGHFTRVNHFRGLQGLQLDPVFSLSLSGVREDNSPAQCKGRNRLRTDSRPLGN